MLLKEADTSHAICGHPKCTNIAVQGCIACRKTLCKIHIDALHEFYPEHQAISISEYHQLSSDLCEEHGMALTSYCVDDNKLQCPTCCHACLLQEHRLIPFKQLVERGTFLCSPPGSDDIFQQEALISQLNSEEQDLNRATSTCIDKIHEQFSRMRTLLDEREAALISAISGQADEIRRKLTTERESTTALIDALRLLLDPGNVLQASSNPASQLKYAKAFKTFVTAFQAKELPTRSKGSSSKSNEQKLYYKVHTPAFNTMATIVKSLEQMQTVVHLEKAAPKLLHAVMLGLQGSGKTSLLYQLKFAEFSEHTPTIGFNQELIHLEDVALQIDDVGGQEKMRPLWKNFVKADSIVIFVVDGADNQRMKEAKQELHRVISVIQEAKLLASCKKNPFVLVFSNKQDHPLAGSGAERMIEDLGMRELKNVDWFVQPCSAVTGHGIHEGIEEALHMLKEN